jgi:hypothetical protein
MMHAMKTVEGDPVCEGQRSAEPQALNYAVAPAGINKQCGGKGWPGPFECVPDAICKYENEYFFICVDDGKSKCRSLWENCGGQYYEGETCCKYGSTCQYQNPFYSQCLY